MEVLYLSEARRVDLQLAELIDLVVAGSNYAIVPVDASVIAVAADIHDVPELHDRIIVASAKLLGVPILSSDVIIQNSTSVTTLW